MCVGGGGEGGVFDPYANVILSGKACGVSFRCMFEFYDGIFFDVSFTSRCFICVTKYFTPQVSFSIPVPYPFL